MSFKKILRTQFPSNAILVTVGALFSLSMAAGFNCSRHAIRGPDVQGAPGAGGGAGGPPPQPATGRFEASLILNGQLMKSMLSMVGIQTPSAAVLNTFKEKQFLFAENASIKNANAPMLMALTNLAGEICKQAVGEEKAQAESARQLFGAFDFTKGPSSVSLKQINDAANALGRSVFGRNPSLEEQMIFEEFATGFVADLSASEKTSATQTEVLAAQMCTLALSSLDAWSI